MKDSPQQTVIYKAVIETNKNLCISSGPGTGKTTTIVNSSKLVPVYKSSLFLAFNKSIVEELKSRLSPNIECSTIHSLGYKALYSHYRTPMNLNEYKSLKFINEVLKEVTIKPEEKNLYLFTISDLINICRMTLTPWDPKSIAKTADKYGIVCNIEQITGTIKALALLEKYNNGAVKGKRDIDFVDMCYLPATIKNIRPKQYDVVFCDESQDLSAMQHMFIEKIINSGGRSVFVYDKNQAIYGFAGSDMESVEKLEQRPNTITLPLSVSYRCGKNIVARAREIYPAIDPFEDALDGEVRDGSVNELKENDFVLCRNTRPLIALWFELIGKNKKATVLGKEIEKGLLALISKVSHLDKFEALAKLDSELKWIEEKLIEKGVKKPKEHLKYLNFQEKVSVIELISDKFIYMNEVESCLKEIFSDKTGGIKLMTMHKSKGLENDRVFIIRKDLIPSKYAVKDWQKTQEKNLMFVAITRAKKQLVFITDWKDE